MTIDALEERVEWTLKLLGPGNIVKRKSQQLTLLGAIIKQSWIDNSRIETWEVFFEGALAEALRDLREAARNQSDIALALPILRLRASVSARIPGVISLDRDLGIAFAEGNRRAAVILYRVDELTESNKTLAKNVTDCLKRWHHDVLDPWAERYGNAGLAQRVLKAIDVKNIAISPVERKFTTSVGGVPRPDFSLIIRSIADRLVGEELFPGLGPCELVLDAVGRDPGRSNSLDLMTSPLRLPGRDDMFSMVAKLSVVTMPYGKQVYLRVAAAKRVWSAKLPLPKRNAPYGIKAYIVAPGRPIFTNSVQRSRESGWQFGDDYAEWQQIAKGELPETLKDAVAKQSPAVGGWWVGFPELTTLFDSVSPRTVFEGDELDLCEVVTNRLPDVLDAPIPFRSIALPRGRASADVSMLRLADLGLAGQALTESDDDDSVEDDTETANAEAASSDNTSRENITRHREQNIDALKAIHGDSKPTLWSFCSTQAERELIEKSVEQLFGNAVILNTELLPASTHGLKEHLPGSHLKASARFDLRVQAWKPAAEVVRKSATARFVLVCAADKEQGRVEDPVNYYAGIHTMCWAGDANVHHVLPIGGGDPARATQNFVHRLQSALLDVFFAHSGMVFGTEAFLKPLLALNPPRYIYGIQAMRSNARAYSGEMGVSFLVFTRLEVCRGTTEVLYVYREKRSAKKTDWMAFSQGLRWLGSQRALDSDENWLRSAASEQVRFLLGEIASSDPRAIVLIDWSTMANLWKGISDEDLTRSGVAKIDNVRDIGAACPQMTLVRLRRGDNSVALRARSTSIYERSRQRQGFGALAATGEVYTETYGTTTKAIVAMTPASVGTPARSKGHYIQSMKYRKTVQILRGQSCYRTTERMRAAKGAPNTFELNVVEPSKQDAALPSPLEVTVMTCPGDVNPDNIAIAVLGLRLGYFHYGDWTALPAPLFFKRKIDDHVVRYRSPASAGASEEPAEEEAQTNSPEVSEINSDAPDTSATSNLVPPSPASDYLARTVQEVIAPSDTPEPSDPVNTDAGVAIGPPAESTSHSDAEISDAELESASNCGVSDARLLEIVQSFTQIDVALFGSRATFRKSQLYGSMLRGQIRVQVPLPYFVDAKGIFGDEAPSDREALRRFWRNQQSQKWIKTTEQIPPLAKMVAWIMRRLQIPQSGHSLYSSAFFPRGSMFAVIRIGWSQYVSEERARAEDSADVADLSETDVDLGKLTSWATLRGDDRLLAWLIFGCAHFPIASGVLDEVFPALTLPLGNLTREAIFYFITSVRAVRAVCSADSRTRAAGFVFSARPGPLEPDLRRREVRTASVGESRPLIAMEAAFSEPGPTPGGFTASIDESEIAASVGAPIGKTPTASDLQELMNRLVPGGDQFQMALQDLNLLLDVLTQTHRKLCAQKELERITAEQEAVHRRAREKLAHERAEVQSRAQQMLEDMRSRLPDTQSWQVQATADFAKPLEEIRSELDQLELQIASVKGAQDEYEIVIDKATPRKELPPREAARHRVQWHSAVESAHQTLELSLVVLMNKVRASQAFVWSGETAEAPPTDAQAREDDLASMVPIEKRARQASAPTESADGAEAELVDVEGSNTTDLASTVEVAEIAPETRVPTTPDIYPGPSDQNQSHTDVQPLTTDLPPTHDEMSLAIDEPSIQSEPFTEVGRASALLGLLKVNVFALAEVYIRALQLNSGAVTIGDYGIVVLSAIETIRRLRGDAVPDGLQTGVLKSRIEADELELPGTDKNAGRLGVLAAGVGEMVFPNLENSGRWTFIEYMRPRVSDCPPLNNLIDRLSELEGFNLGREVLVTASIGARDAAQVNVTRMRERAKGWATDGALYRNWSHSDYRKLHELLFANDEYPIAHCLNVIGIGNDDELEEAYRDARKRLERPLPTIDDLAKRCGRRRSFEGTARAQIAANIEQTHQFIKDYREAIARANGLHVPVSQNVRTLLQGLYKVLVAAIDYVRNLAINEARSQVYRELALIAMSELKRLFDCTEIVPSIQDSDQMLLLRLPLGADLRPSLWPQADTSGNLIPPTVDATDAIEEIENLAMILDEAGGKCSDDIWIKQRLDQAGVDHLAHNRLLPLRFIDKRLGRPATRTHEQKECLRMLFGELQTERQRVTHAMALGALTQSEAARMLKLIEELLQNGRNLGDMEMAPIATPDFPQAYVAIRRLVAQPLEAKLAASTASFLQELDRFVVENLSFTPPNMDIDRIRSLASTRSASSMRAARDMFSLLKEGALPKRTVTPQTQVTQDYKVFVDTLKRDVHGHRPLVESLITKLSERSNETDPAWLTKLNSVERDDARAFLETWEKLCGAQTLQEIETNLGRLFRGLRPIEPDIVVDAASNKSQRTEFILNNSPFAGLDRTVTGVFIPPILGSGASFVQGILFRQKPSEVMVTQAIDERAQTVPTFILGRGNWPLERRALLSRHRPVMLIDDDLVAYAAVHPNERLQKLLQVALLTFNDNPYDDYGRPVPPEMFFGRRAELTRLRQVKTAAVLYGGRRLGKSSLLDQLQRDAQRLGGEVVLYLTLDRADRGISEDHSFLAWDAILRKLVQASVIGRPKQEITKASQIRRWIEDEIVGGRCKAKAIFLLIDEADELMGQDLNQRGPFVSSLMSLVESVRKKCAMRFVIAGLHNLTRIANDENSPLGKFEPIALKPFWVADDIQRGIELIRVPLEGLGFYFSAGQEDMPLRIMAVCNFYPAFIQLYCKKLVAHLYNRRDKSPPPTYILDSDLEAVELDNDFLSDIRSKFRLNLDLDKRYAAIALILADQYYGDGAKSLTAAELRTLCDLVAPKHFESTGQGAFDALLEEMEILTILERLSSKYSLRTPNIAMMLGDRASVGHQLETLGAEKAIQQRSRGELRSTLVSLKSSRERVTFPLPSSWVRGIFGVASGDREGSTGTGARDLIVMVGNDLSGLTELNRLKGEWLIGDTAMIDVGVYSSPQIARSHLVRTVRSVMARTERGRRLHCIASGSWKIADLADYARLALTLGSPFSGTTDTSAVNIMRLALIANPSRAYELAQHVAQKEIVASTGWSVTAVPPWTDDAIFYRLEALEKPDLYNSAEARKAIEIATCGFGAEIERECGARRTVEEALKAPAENERRLAPDLATYYRTIGMPSVITQQDYKNIELLLRTLHGEARQSGTTEEFRSECGVSPSLFLFLQWMGLLNEAPGGTWAVPELYRRLFK
jgi:ElaB/YqjD/DUF883 family membrane-anchored ribosome-binding protein